MECRDVRKETDWMPAAEDHFRAQPFGVAASRGIYLAASTRGRRATAPFARPLRRPTDLVLQPMMPNWWIAGDRCAGSPGPSAHETAPFAHPDLSA